MAVAPALTALTFKVAHALPQPIPFEGIPNFTTREQYLKLGLPDPWANLSPEVLAAKQQQAVQQGVQISPVAGAGTPQNGVQQGSAGLGLPAVGAGLTDVARGEIGAINAAVSARLSSALQASNIEASQRGGLRTGTQQTERDRLRLGFAEIAARQVGAVGLESEALRQSQLNAQRNFDLQVASLEAQKAQGTNQLITAVATLLGQGAFEIFGGQIKSKLFGGGGLDDTGGLDFGGDILGPEFNDEFIG